MLPSASVSGVTRAYVGEGTDLTAGSLSVTSDGTLNATATTLLVNIGAWHAGGAVQATATVSGTVESFVGARVGNATTAAVPKIRLGTGNMTVDADAFMRAKATADGGGAASA